MLDCDPAYTDPSGQLPMGAIAVLADSVIARTLLTCLPTGLMVVTGRVQVEVVRRVPVGTELRAHGRVVTWDEGSGLTTADILDGGGELVARSSGRSYARPGRFGVPYVTPGNGPPDDGDPDGEGFLGLAWSPEADGWVSARLTGIDRLANMYGALHGGSGAAVLEATLARAAAERGGQPLDLEVHYLRPAPAAGVPLRTRARVVHATRRFTLGTAELLDDTGRIYATATGSYGV